jgi:putative membrane protein
MKCRLDGLEVHMSSMLRNVALPCAVALGLIASGPSLHAAQSQQPQQKPKPTTPAPATTAQAKPTSGSADTSFIRQAAMDGMAEVQLGQLAAKNASSADVKQFGQRMVDDHSKANSELKSIASQQSVTLPTELDGKHKATVDKLSKLQGEEFDRAYMTEMVSDHAQAVSLFQREAKTGKDEATKAFAEKTLPTLQEHHKMAQSIHAKTGKSAKADKGEKKL